MRTPWSLKGTRAASATFVKTRGDRDSPKGRTCTDMLVLRTQTAGMACGTEGSTHGSTGLQVNAADRNGDGCIRRRSSAWASWASRCADPRLVVTHRFSWAQWSKGWKTLPSYRLEGPVPSRPSPVGQRFLSQVMGIGCLHCCEVDAPELGRTPGELNRIAESDGPQEPARRLGSSRHPDTVQAGPSGPPTYPQ